MAFPTVVTPRGTSGALSSLTAHSVTMPAGATTARGVLVIFTADSGPTFSISGTGWTLIGQLANGATMGSAVIYKRPGVTLNALTVNLSFAEEGTYIVIPVDGAASDEDVYVASTAVTGANTNPPSLTPTGGARDYLWVAARTGEAAVVATAAPANYANLTSATGGASGASTSTAERSLNAASEDPGAFTSATEDCVAWTIAIPPAVNFVTHTGAAAFAGAGAMSVSGQSTQRVPAAFTGAGALTAATRQTHAASAAFSGAGSLTAGSGVDRPATATFAGAGQMTAAGTRVHSASASFAGAGQMVATPGQLAAAMFAGSGSMTAAARQTHQVAASFAGSGQLTVAGQSDQRIAAAFAGTGQMTVAGTPVRPAAATFTGAGQMLADGRRVHPAQAVFAGAGSFTATGVRVRPAAATFAGSGRLTASARLDRPGLNISLWAVTDDGLLPLPAREKLDLSRERNSVGSVTVDYPAGAPGFDLLRAGVANDRDVEVEIWLDGKQDGALRALLMQAAGDDNDSRAVWQFSGHFLEWLLAEAIIYNQPAPADKGELVFSGSNAGEVMATCLNQAQARGALSGVTRDWTTSLDSSGQAWPQTVSGLKFSPRTTLLQVAQKLVDLDLAEFEMTRDRVLRLWAPGRRGVDRSVGNDPALFRHGRVTSWPVRHTVRDSATTVLVAGAEGVYREASNATALARRGRRIEQGADANNLADTTAVQAYATRTVEVAGAGQTEIRHPLTFGPGDPRPGAGFDVADKVISERAGGARLAVDLQQWTLSDARGETVGEVVLNDRIASRLERLRRQLDAIGSGAAVVGTSTPPPTDDTVAPAAPTGLTVTSLAYQDEVTAPTYTVVVVGYVAPTLNSDGTDLTDLAGFRARYRYRGLVQTGGIGEPGEYIPGGGDGQWNYSDIVDSGATSITMTGVDAGVPIEVQVQAFDSAENTNFGPWSVGALHTTATDNTPPPAPSTPTLSVWFATLDITWDGLDSVGADMRAAAPDFDHVEVHVSTANNFTPDPSTFKARLFGPGTWNEPGIPHGVGHYARLVAVDRAGNPSTVSASSTVATAQKLVQIDIGPNAIGQQQVIDGEIVRAKIGTAAINSAKVEELQAGLITTGTLTATVTLSGIIQTAASGQRMRIDSTGWKAYRADGTTLFAELNIPTSSMLVTGEFRTGNTGERVQILMDGTMRFYPAAGSSYSEIANNGNELFLRGPLNGSNQSGVSFYWSSGVGHAFGVYPSALNSRISVGNRLIDLRAPVVNLGVDRAYATADGTPHRVLIRQSNSDGSLRNSYWHFQERDDGTPCLMTPGHDCLYAPANGVHYFAHNNNNPAPVWGGAYSNVSGSRFKDQIAELDLDALSIVNRLRVRRFRYLRDAVLSDGPGGRFRRRRTDLTPEQVADIEAEFGRDAEQLHEYVSPGWAFTPDPQEQIGWIAEDVAEVEPRLVDRMAGTDMVGVNMTKIAALTWEAVRQLAARVAQIETRTAPPPSGLGRA